LRTIYPDNTYASYRNYSLTTWRCKRFRVARSHWRLFIT